MINPNELRIGNWVLFDNNVVTQVTVIGEDFLGTTKTIAYVYMGKFYPIELTPEILEKCGFEERTGFAEGIGDYNWFDNGQFETVRMFGNIIKLKDVDSVPIKYLHQFQNLYFALTGTELNFKSK